MSQYLIESSDLKNLRATTPTFSKVDHKVPTKCKLAIIIEYYSKSRVKPSLWPKQSTFNMLLDCKRQLEVIFLFEAK